MMIEQCSAKETYTKRKITVQSQSRGTYVLLGDLGVGRLYLP